MLFRQLTPYCCFAKLLPSLLVISILFLISTNHNEPAEQIPPIKAQTTGINYHRFMTQAFPRWSKILGWSTDQIRHAHHLFLPPPFLPGTQPGYALLDAVIYDAPLRIMYCGITKTAHSQFRALFCDVLTNGSLPELKTDPFESHHSELCQKLELVVDQIPDKFTRLSQIYGSPSWHILATVRDPLDRFISAYVDKCIHETTNGCYGCPRSVAGVDCFAEQTKIMMSQLSRGEAPYGTYDYHVNHLYPQFWSCDFQAHLGDYELFRYMDNKEFRRNVREKLAQYGVPNASLSTGWGEHRNRPFLGIKTSHATSHTQSQAVRRWIYANPTTLSNILSTYFIDYITLNLSLPTEAVRILCENQYDLDDVTGMDYAPGFESVIDPLCYFL